MLPNVAMAAQIAQAVGVPLDQLAGLAEADTELVVLARKLGALLSGAHREALEGHLNAVLELANGVALNLGKGK